MFAVIKTGGKQYKVRENDLLRVEKLVADKGDTITFDQVVLAGDDGKTIFAANDLQKISVTAEVLEQGRADKITVFKKKRRQGYRRTKGHRQDQTVIRVTGIGGSGAPKKAAKPAESKSSEKPATAEKKATAAKAKPASKPKKK